MPSTRINGIDVYYEVSGNGPRLLLVNGTGSTIGRSRPLIGLFVGDFQVAVADSRGIGRTGMPAGPYAMADLASDAIGLADRLEWDAFNLLGISFGGMVAQEVAVTAPERIERLVLMCTSPGGAGGSSYPIQEWARLDAATRAARSIEVVDTRFTPEWLAEHPRERALIDQMAQAATEEPTAEALRGADLQLQARAGHDVFDRLPHITCPTLVACGRFDGIAPPENGAAIAAQIRGARLRLYEGGHGFFVQDPAAIPEIIEFLRLDG